MDGVLITHEHYDHVGGLDDLRPFCRFRDVPVYAEQYTAERLRPVSYTHLGESLSLTWELHESEIADFSECVQHIWEYSYDTNCPQTVSYTHLDVYKRQVIR